MRSRRILHTSTGKHVNHALRPKANRSTYQDPFPILPIVDKAGQNRSEEVTASKHECVETNVCTTLMRKILQRRRSEFSRSIIPMRLTISVTETSHNDSIGAPKKPCRILFAIHWPLLFVYGAQIIKACDQSVHMYIETKKGHPPWLLMSRRDILAVFHTAVPKAATLSSPIQKRETAHC